MFYITATSRTDGKPYTISKAKTQVAAARQVASYETGSNPYLVETRAAYHSFRVTRENYKANGDVR